MLVLELAAHFVDYLMGVVMCVGLYSFDGDDGGMWLSYEEEEVAWRLVRIRGVVTSSSV